MASSQYLYKNIYIFIIEIIIKPVKKAAIKPVSLVLKVVDRTCSMK